MTLSQLMFQHVLFKELQNLHKCVKCYRMNLHETVRNVPTIFVYVKLYR